MSNKIQVVVKKQGKQNNEVLWFYTQHEGYKHCLGCIYNFQYTKDDFKWLFDFLSVLDYWKLEKFSDCKIEESEQRCEDWLDSYCDKTIKHTFPQIKDKFITRLNDFNSSENCDIQDVFNFVNKYSGVKFEVIRRCE